MAFTTGAERKKQSSSTKLSTQIIPRSLETFLKKLLKRSNLNFHAQIVQWPQVVSSGQNEFKIEFWTLDV